MMGKSSSDPRKMMEKTIVVMRHSVHEDRQDGRPDLMVGAVLVRPDESIETAARGELRSGDHAEFTLLERKCRAENLEGCVLYTSLEPCLERNPPKRGCARHIVSARIDTVYVGIEDDNPAVAGKGIEYLRRNGVTIHMFDRDLQEVILNENEKFFEWARQQVDKAEESPIRLSKYEDSLPAVELRDLSDDALRKYQSQAKIRSEGDADFQRMLVQQGVLVREDSGIVPSAFGLLLFGEDPSLALPQAKLLARADLPDGKSSRKEFAQALVLIPEAVESWLSSVLPSTIDRSQMVRKELVDLPFEMIREAVVNALVHRDYDIEGQKCQLVVTSDSITISSPGGPVPPITLDQMQSLSAPMKSRNPILHHVFSRMGMAEEQGLGLSSLKEQAQKLGLPLPGFAMDGGSLVLTIYRTRESAGAKLGPAILGKLSRSELAGWNWLATQDWVSSTEYGDSQNLEKRAGTLHLKKFLDLGIAAREGKGRATRYRAIKQPA